MSDYQAPFNLIHNSGWAQEFETIAELADFCRDEGIWGIGLTHVHHSQHQYGERMIDNITHYSWIVRDNWGQIIDSDKEFRELYFKHRVSNADKRKQLKLIAEANNLPIPYTGKNRYVNYSWRWRYPAHKGYQVMKNIASDMKHDEDHIGIPIKGRLRKMLTRDDEPHRGRQGFCWKRHRATQWK